ncbi:hypothetical protein EXIGLDRAFT_744678 [Exidia glandulosa HHB12029]|uniref:F-box domain-containing protein n=1 Tax=Exidia glandulosa HHB12029 TaxID=1314781 RepID=A0A165PI90_EXIGL|nr:hypothetical protein EXIGLDRAFT_744678 [Exidia glandulosa HHB12029]
MTTSTLHVLSTRLVDLFQNTVSTSSATPSLDVLCTHLHKTQLARRRGMNERSGFVALPIPILCCIVRQLGPWGKIVMTHVCHRIRSLLLSEQSLWTNIAVYYAPSDAVATYLVRSRPVLARVAMALGPLYFADRLRILQLHLPRIEELDLDIVTYSKPLDFWNGFGPVEHEPGPLMQSDWEQLYTMLSEPAPHMTTFALDDMVNNSWEYNHIPWEFHAQETRWSLPVDLLGGEPGALHSCYLRGFALPRQVPPAFANLTLLEYRAPIVLSRIILDDLLGAMPMLQRLGLSFLTWLNDSDESASIISPSSLHPSLKEVAIYRIDDKKAPAIAYFETHAVTDIVVRYFQISSGATALHLDAAVEVTLRLERIIIERTNAYASRLHFNEPSMLPSLVYPSFGGLQRLIVDESIWTMHSPFPPAPNVQLLRIILSSCVDLEDPFATSFTFAEPYNLFACEVEEALECPALTVFELSAHCSSPCGRNGPNRCLCSEPRLSFVDVASFVRLCLKTASRRLQTLRLHGIQSIDWDPEAAWSSLYDVACEVDMEAQAWVDTRTHGDSLRAQTLTGVFDPSGGDFFGRNWGNQLHQYAYGYLE